MTSLRAKEVFCILFAIVLFCSGVLLIGFSVVLSYKLIYHYEFVPSGSLGPFIFLFILGISHLFLTWLAVGGPTRKHDCHIILFLLVAIALLLAECAVGVWSIILWDEVDVEAVLLMTKSFESVIAGEDFNKNTDWNKLQSKMKCCGLNGIGDYKTTKGSYPVSCCEEPDGPNITCYQDSCRLPLARYVKAILFKGAVMSFTSCLLQAFGFFLFYSFFQSLRKDRSEKLARRISMQRELTENREVTTPHGSTVRPVDPPPPTPAFDDTPKSHKSSKRRSSKGSAPRSPPV